MVNLFGYDWVNYTINIEFAKQDICSDEYLGSIHVKMEEG